MLCGFGIFLLGLARGLGGRDLRTIATGLTAFGVVMACIGIVQKALWNGLVYGFWEPIGKGGPFGPFVNRNHFAGWMLLAIPVAIGYLSAQIAKGMQGVKPGWRNRLLLVLNRPGQSHGAHRVRHRRHGPGAGDDAVALGRVVPAAGAGHLGDERVAAPGHGREEAVAERLPGVRVRAGGGWAGIDALAARFANVDWQMGGRAGAWDDGWRIHEMFPWLGTGFNTYGTATVLYQQHDLKSHYVEAHNDYLQILVEGGWLVAVPVLLTLLAFAREVWKRFREGEDDPTGYWIRLGAVTGIVAIAFQSVVEFSLQMPGNAALFCVLGAIAIRKAAVKGAHASRPSKGPAPG